MEINGIANVKAHMALMTDFLNDVVRSTNDRDELAKHLLSIEEQLVLLERYMIAYDDAMKENLKNTQYYGRIHDQIPFWHDIKANPSKYLTLKEKIS